jgi:transcriptional regulator with XRE-family HTH domain
MIGVNYHSQAFGRTLRILRKKSGRTQEALAFDAGLDRTYISLLELGMRSPTLDTIMALCHALKLPISELAVSFEVEVARQDRA